MPLQENDLERYLDGDLPPADRARVDRALAADPALRAELQLRREIEMSLKDDGEHALLANLERIGDRVTADLPAEKNRRSARYRWGLIGIVLLGLLGLLGWLLWPTTPVDTNSPTKDTEELIPLPLPPTDPQPSAAPTRPQASLPAVPAPPVEEPPTTNPPNPELLALYAPNPALERAAVQLRGDVYTLTLDPVPDVVPVPAADETGSIRLSGRVAAADTPPELLLHVLSNRLSDYENSNYLQSIAVSWEELVFTSRIEVPRSPGKYYWVLEDADEEAIIRVGAFDVK